MFFLPLFVLPFENKESKKKHLVFPQEILQHFLAVFWFFEAPTPRCISLDK